MNKEKSSIDIKDVSFFFLLRKVWNCENLVPLGNLKIEAVTGQLLF